MQPKKNDCTEKTYTLLLTKPKNLHTFIDKADFCLRLLRKKSRSVRLFVCKRTHDGSLSLPTFCGVRLVGAAAPRLLVAAFTLVDAIAVSSHRKPPQRLGVSSASGSSSLSLLLAPPLLSAVALRRGVRLASLGVSLVAGAPRDIHLAKSDIFQIISFQFKKHFFANNCHVFIIFCTLLTVECFFLLWGECFLPSVESFSGE